MNKTDIILDNIYNRKSVRQYTDKKITKEDLDKIIKAGISAPSGLNLQPWHFIVIQDKQTLIDMASIHEYAGMFKDATAGIIVLYDTKKTYPGLEELAIQDLSAATENILLATEALGLGAVWTAIHPVEKRINIIIKYFNLPENIIPFSLIALGYPLKKQEPLDKMDTTKIHWDKW